MPNDDPEPQPKKGLPDDLAAFDAKLEKARQEEAGRRLWKRDMDKPPSSALGLAFRVSVELVSALAVGLAIGWALDNWLGTRPWLMIVFIAMGGIAGMLNVYRVAKHMGSGLGYQEKGQTSNNTENGEAAKEQGRDRSV